MAYHLPNWIRRLPKIGGLRKGSKFDPRLMELDYLVFSAHKTATQSITKTLTNNGFKCRHGHILEHFGIARGGLEAYVDHYHAKRKRQLPIISIFREPIERHISSFFQWYGSRPVSRKEVAGPHETIIYTHTIPDLQEKLAEEIENDTLVGRQESIASICRELRIDTASLRPANRQDHCWAYETETYRLYLGRFDRLVKHLEGALSFITGTTITGYDANIGDTKWYRDIYRDFKASFRLPHATIRKVYAARRDLINLFYQRSYEMVLKDAIARHGRATAA